MGVRWEWVNESQTIFRVIYEGTWTMTEFFDCYTVCNAVIEQVNHPVVVLLDYRYSHHAPPRICSFMSYAQRHAPPNICHYILLGDSPHHRAVYAAIQSVMQNSQHIRLRLAESFDKALELAQIELGQAIES